MTRWMSVAVLLMGAGGAWGAEAVDVCYDYGCAVEAPVLFSGDQLAVVAELMGLARTAEDERALLALAVGRLYTWSGEQTPVWRDRGGNIDDDDNEAGRMDCIDHSTTTTRFLNLIEAHGWLRFHRVLPVERRTLFIVSQHFSAAIEELGPVRDPEHTEPERFVVDTWFRDNGQPAVILPLEDWQDGAGPED